MSNAKAERGTRPGREHQCHHRSRSEQIVRYADSFGRQRPTGAVQEEDTWKSRCTAAHVSHVTEGKAKLAVTHRTLLTDEPERQT